MPDAPNPPTHHHYHPAAPHHPGLYGVAPLDPTLALMYRLKDKQAKKLTTMYRLQYPTSSKLQSTPCPRVVIIVCSLPCRSRRCSLSRRGIRHTHFSELCVGHCIFCLGVPFSLAEVDVAVCFDAASVTLTFASFALGIALFAWVWHWSRDT